MTVPSFRDQVKQELVRQDLLKMEAELREKTLAQGWRKHFTDRQWRLIINCRTYTANDPAGLPGHNLMLIIDQMAAILDGCYHHSQEPQKAEPVIGQHVECSGPNCGVELKPSYKFTVGDPCPECGCRYLVRADDVHV